MLFKHTNRNMIAMVGVLPAFIASKNGHTDVVSTLREIEHDKPTNVRLEVSWAPRWITCASEPRVKGGKEDIHHRGWLFDYAVLCIISPSHTVYVRLFCSRS